MPQKLVVWWLCVACLGFMVVGSGGGANESDQWQPVDIRGVSKKRWKRGISNRGGGVARSEGRGLGFEVGKKRGEVRLPREKRNRP